jgi:DNA-binding SARP family transcriptional activator
MEYRILGPLLVSRDGEQVMLDGRRNKELLSLLLLHANEVVSPDRLVEDLWSDTPPAAPRKAVQVYVARLRKALGEDVLETSGAGYVLRVHDGELDVWRFEQLAEKGRRTLGAGDPARAATFLRHALALWRGPALADVIYEAFAQAEAARLEELRLRCLETRIDAELALGRHADAVGELELLADQHGDRERLRTQWMLALYRSGRQEEALDVYRRTRRRLMDELGIEPGPELRQLEHAILAHDPRLVWTAPRGVAPNARRTDRAFVGRELQLERITTDLEDLFRARGTLLMLRGEPGIGKTWLAEEAAARAEERGALVLVGRCWESGGAPPYWPWVQCLRRLVAQTEPELLAAQLDAGAGDVALIVPELQELGRSVPRRSADDPESARFRLFEAVVTLLRGVARARPIVVVLEDLHAADSPSLLLLRYLTDSLAGMRVLVIATRRERDPAANPDSTASVAELARSERFRDMPLDGLDPDEVARLVHAVAPAAPDALVAAIQDRADGHPLFVAELARLLAAKGRLDTIPPGIRAAVAQRVGLLTEECRRVLHLAAVVGRDFTSDVLVRAGDETPETIVELLGEAIVAATVVPVADAPGRFRFAHALVREALYDELSPADRMRLHRAVAEALEAIHAAELEPHVAELAHHHFLAAPAGSPSVARAYAVRAAERATTELAYEEAARLYEIAVKAHELEPAADPITRGELLLGLGAAQASVSDQAAARQTYARAADVARGAGAPGQLARAALGYGGHLVALPADDRREVALIEEALGALGDDDDVLRARLLARLACADHRRPSADQAVEMARRLGDPATLTWALTAQIVLAWDPDNLELLNANSEEIIAVAAQARDVEQALHGHLLRIEFRLAMGRIAAVRDDLAISKRLARELKLPAADWHVTVHEIELVLLHGDFDAARELIERARQLSRRTPSVEIAATDIFQRFPLLLEDGRLAELRPELEELAAIPLYAGTAGTILARLEYEIGEVGAARDRLESLARDGWAAVPRGFDWFMTAPLLAETAAALGASERAAELYEMLAPYASQIAIWVHGFSLGSVSRYVGLAAAASWQLDEAVRRLEDAAAANEAIGARPFAAYAKADHARVLLTRRALGDGEHARDLLLEALAAYEQLGMAASAHRVASLLGSDAESLREAPRTPLGDTGQRAT